MNHRTHVVEFDAFKASAETIALYDALPEDDRLALVRAFDPGRLPSETLNAYTGSGVVEFTGNQWNESWRWNEKWLAALARSGELARFYLFVKSIGNAVR